MQHCSHCIWQVYAFFFKNKYLLILISYNSLSCCPQARCLTTATSRACTSPSGRASTGRCAPPPCRATCPPWTTVSRYLHISTRIYTFILTTPQLGTPDPRQSPRSPAPATLPRPSETARPPPRPRPSPRPASKVSECVRCPAPDVQMSTSSHNRNHEIRCSISRTREPLLRLRLQGHQLHGQALLPGRRQGVCQCC